MVGPVLFRGPAFFVGVWGWCYEMRRWVKGRALGPR